MTNLQHITFKQMPGVETPFGILANMPTLTSLGIEILHPDIVMLTKLQSLFLSPTEPFRPFSESFSALCALTCLAAGSTVAKGISYKDFPNIKVFPNLQKLTLTGIMGDLRDLDHGIQKKAQVWKQVASLTCVKHLELMEVARCFDSFESLASMTQLTCLHFFPTLPVGLDGLSKRLLCLSTLSSLDTLKARFSFYQRDEHHNYVRESEPVPDVGAGLKAALL